MLKKKYLATLHDVERAQPERVDYEYKRDGVLERYSMAGPQKKHTQAVAEVALVSSSSAQGVRGGAGGRTGYVGRKERAICSCTVNRRRHGATRLLPRGARSMTLRTRGVGWSTRYPEAEVIRVVLDNLNTHRAGSLYETIAPAEDRCLVEKLEFHYTPKHGS
jgi:hypothetical protein